MSAKSSKPKPKTGVKTTQKTRTKNVKKAPVDRTVEPAGIEVGRSDSLLSTDDALYECQPATDNDGVLITDLAAERPREEPAPAADPPVDTPARAEVPEDPPAAPADIAEAPHPEISEQLPLIEEPVPQDPVEVKTEISPAPKKGLASLLQQAFRHLPGNKSRKRQPKEPRPPSFFSDDHPQLYAMTSWALPKIHVLVFMTMFVAGMLFELSRGNAYFFYDWLNAIPFLPELYDILTVPGEWDRFVQYYLQAALLIGFIVAWFSVLFYIFGWRWLFKTYWRIANRVESPEGRVYWWNGNMWHRMWDRLYNSPPRTSYTFWIKTSWWPLLNIINPASSLVQLKISATEEVEYRGPWKLCVHERSRRIMKSMREYETVDGQYSSLKIPVRDSANEFINRSREMIQDTHLISLGNPSVRNKQLENCAFPVSTEFKELIVNAREEQKGKQST